MKKIKSRADAIKFIQNSAKLGGLGSESFEFIPTFKTEGSISGYFQGVKKGAVISGTINGDAFSTSVAKMNFTGLTAGTAYTIEFTQTVNGQTSASTAFIVTMDEGAGEDLPASAVLAADGSYLVSADGAYIVYA